MCIGFLCSFLLVFENLMCEEDESKSKKLQALVAAVNNNNNNSHIVLVPAGSNALYISRVLLSCASSFVSRRKGDKGAQQGLLLSWSRRVKLVVGAAKGLEYLHQNAHPHIIHRDIKFSNGLFDEDITKIADFDLSNQAPDMAARLHSTRVLVTFGYHAPEYAMTGQLSSKE
ncbi:hypothetical protein L1887_19596 [Cichorium endivia]|nr:hypothetical protein L1887_19596 [Cichorium endivia]